MLLLDAAGKERVGLEGYLPNDDFVAALKNGPGRIASSRRNALPTGSKPARDKRAEMELESPVVRRGDVGLPTN